MSVIAWDSVVTELFVSGVLPLFLPHTTHIFLNSLIMAYPKPSDVLLSILVQFSIHHNFKTGKLPPWVGLIVTERHSDLCLCFTVSEPGVAPSYKSTCHLRLKISYCPIQRPLCVSSVCRLQQCPWFWLYHLYFSHLMVTMVLLQSRWVSQSRKQTMCKWELHFLCVQCNNARKVPVNMFSKL